MTTIANASPFAPNAAQTTAQNTASRAHRAHVIMPQGSAATNSPGQAGAMQSFAALLSAAAGLTPAPASPQSVLTKLG